MIEAEMVCASSKKQGARKSPAKINKTNTSSRHRDQRISIIVLLAALTALETLFPAGADLLWHQRRGLLGLSRESYPKKSPTIKENASNKPQDSARGAPPETSPVPQTMAGAALQLSPGAQTLASLRGTSLVPRGKLVAENRTREHQFALVKRDTEAEEKGKQKAQQNLVELDPDASDTVPVYMQHMTTILVILHCSVFITGLVGNSLVCLSVYRNKSLQTVTNYYIVNLAVADFLVILICLPPTVYWDLNLTWNFGLILCKLVLYLQVSSKSSILIHLSGSTLENKPQCGGHPCSRGSHWKPIEYSCWNAGMLEC